MSGTRGLPTHWAAAIQPTGDEPGIEYLETVALYAGDSVVGTVGITFDPNTERHFVESDPLDYHTVHRSWVEARRSLADVVLRWLLT